MNEMHVGQFWMPAVIGAFALPLLVFMGYMLKRLPQPTEEDIALRNERVTLDGNGRKLLFRSYAPILTLVVSLGNFMLLVLRDSQGRFSGQYPGYEQSVFLAFRQVDTIVTLVILGIFAAFIFFRSNIRALMCLMGLVIAGCLVMTYVSLNYEALDWQPVVWLFVQSLCLYIAYLTFQTIFFDRFIACFRHQGKRGFLHRHYRLHRLHGYGDSAFHQGVFELRHGVVCALQPHGMRGRRGLCGLVHSGCRIDL